MSDPDNAPTRVLLIGGTSEIGLAIVRRLAQERRVRPFLLGRDPDQLRSSVSLLAQAGCEAGASALLDAEKLESHEHVIAHAFSSAGPFEIVILAIGQLGAQEGLDADRDQALAVMSVNFVGCGSLLLASVSALRDSGAGTMIVLSSVAAERPRATNLVYGAAKAGLDALGQGLADAAPDSVRVMVVRPGFVRTKMTAGLPSVPFATTPDLVAAATVRGVNSRAHTVWAPSVLRYVFSVLRHLPRPVYRRLPL